MGHPSWRRPRTPQQRGLEEGYRSKSETKVKAQLEAEDIEFTYEQEKLKFKQPEKNRTYTPDFIIKTRTGREIVDEVKGLFSAADRQKHLWVREQHPDRDIRFVFDRSKARISKVSKTTYAAWCEKNGFLYADKLIPEAWFNE